MSVLTAIYAEPLAAKPKMNRLELWRHRLTQTGDASGGTIGWSLFVPEGKLWKPESYPKTSHLTIGRPADARGLARNDPGAVRVE